MITSRAKVIADSITPSGCRLTTFECEYPRYIHAEVMTHRDISRNGRSSRAEPFSRALDRAIYDPVEPLAWLYDARGMANGVPMNSTDAFRSKEAWHDARMSAIEACQTLSSIGLHRQYVIRLLEPFLRIKMILSSTDFSNFYNLRIDKAAMPEIQQLAVGMARAQMVSKPEKLKPGQWHLPYVNKDEIELFESNGYDLNDLVYISIARCARVSYDSLDGKNKSFTDDIGLAKRIIEYKHMSPAEHVAKAMHSAKRVANFNGFHQYRHMVPLESCDQSNFDLATRLVEYEGVDYIV